MDPEALAIARERLRPVESVHENQVQPEEHIYAEVELIVLIFFDFFSIYVHLFSYKSGYFMKFKILSL